MRYYFGQKRYSYPYKNEKTYSKLFSLCDNLIITRESKFVNGFLEKQIQTSTLYVIPYKTQKRDSAIPFIYSFCKSAFRRGTGEPFFA